MKNRTGDQWIPMWVDKWLFGSTRHELAPDEQSVWVDFLMLSGKDDGHIRANETTPYPISQLSGLLYKTEELIFRTIEKCIKFGKLEYTKNNTLYVCNFQGYELSKRHKRRIVMGVVSEKKDTSPLGLSKSNLVETPLRPIKKGQSNDQEKE